MCWGDEAVAAADRMKDLDGTHAILANSGLKQNGSITAAFALIGSCLQGSAQSPNARAAEH
jgi:hypothetical protein